MHRIFSWNQLYVVLLRWCLFPGLPLQSIWYIFVFLYWSFRANFFDGDWVHRICQGKEVCGGWIPVEVRSGRQFHSQEILLVFGAWWMVYPVCEDSFKFDIFLVLLMYELLYLFKGGIYIWVFCIFYRYFCFLVGIQEMRRCCFILWFIFSCQSKWCFSYDQLWYPPFSFQLLSWVRIWMIRFCCRICCWYSYFQSSLQSIWEFYKYDSCVIWFLMKNYLLFILSF